MADQTEKRLQRQLLAILDHHFDHHEAARAAVYVAAIASLRSVGPVNAAEFFWDIGDYLDRHSIAEAMQ
jgi:hypothetical protein